MRKLAVLFAVAVLLLIVAAPFARAGPAIMEDQIVTATTANFQAENGVAVLPSSIAGEFGGYTYILRERALIYDMGYDRVLVAKAPGFRSTKWPISFCASDHRLRAAGRG